MSQQRKRGSRALWVVEIQTKEYAWEASIPAFLTEAEANKEQRVMESLKAPKSDKSTFRVRRYTPERRTR